MNSPVPLGLLCAMLLGCGACGCSSSPADAGPEVVYICKETNKVLKAPMQPTPAVNPETGRKTLFRALYCAQCGQWHAIPPEGTVPGNPLAYRCPKHKVAMSADGPIESAQVAGTAR